MIELKEAWESYLENLDEEPLLEAIQRYSIPLPSEFDFPYAHRIRDIRAGGKIYRVVRLADESETVYIYECDTPSLETDGVPYWLKGEKLQRWVRLETEVELDDGYEPEAETNWEMFR